METTTSTYVNLVGFPPTLLDPILIGIFPALGSLMGLINWISSIKGGPDR